MTDRYTLEQFTNVLYYLDGHRPRAIRELFPGDDPATEEYREEWMDRSTVASWFHLDDQNRGKLVANALAFYAAEKARTWEEV